MPPSKLTQEEVEALRSAEPYEVVDSIRVGPGMNAISRGWYNSWFEFGKVDNLTFFSGRDSGAEGAWCNQLTERLSWAFYAYHLGIEFHVPPMFRAYVEEPSDAIVMPAKFIQELPQNLRNVLTIAGSDTILDQPATDMPGGVGSTNISADGNGVGFYQAGDSGQPHLSNRWHFAQPLGIPTNTQFRFNCNIDPVLRAFYQQFENCPGFSNFPGCVDPGDPVRQANIYSIRVRLVGKRLLQLRSARSAP